MFIYNVIFVLTIFGLLCTYNGDLKNKTFNNVLYCILSGIIIGTVCLHGENIGHDTHEYLYLYMHPNEMDFSPIEIILPFGVNIFKTIYANPYFINFCLLLIAQIPIFILINKFSKNRFYSIFLYISYTTSVSMFLHSMTAVRQSLAIGFFAYAIYVFINNDYKFSKKCIIYIILMLLSHVSSFLALPIFFICNINISKKAYCIGIFIAYLIGLYIDVFHSTLTQVLTLIEKGFYVGASINESTILTTLPFVIPFIYIVVTLPVERLQTAWIKGMFLLTITVCMLFPIAHNLDRIVAYYCLLSIIAFPELLSIKYYRIKKFAFYIFNIVVILYFSYKFYKVFEILADMDYPYAPYRTFL